MFASATRATSWSNSPAPWQCPRSPTPCDSSPSSGWSPFWPIPSVIPAAVRRRRGSGRRRGGRWKGGGGVMQVDAATVLTGRGRGQRARELLAHGLADIIAADNHGDDRMIGAGYRHLCEQGGGGP